MPSDDGSRGRLLPADSDGFPIGLRRDLMTQELVEICRANGDFQARLGFTPPWISYYLYSDGEIVGGGAFVGPPREAQVEIAYFTLTGIKRRGFATATARELIAIAWKADAALLITAKTAPEENASTRILRTHGFSLAADPVMDADIGLAWLWTLAPSGGS